MKSLLVTGCGFLLLVSLGVAQSGSDPKASSASAQSQSQVKSAAPQSKTLTAPKTGAMDSSQAPAQAAKTAPTSPVVTNSQKSQPKDDSSKAASLSSIANIITSNLAGGCLPQKVSVKNPDCVVEDVTRLPDGTTRVYEIPRCDRAHGTRPCWRLEVKAQCARISPQSLGVTVDRPPSGAPPGTDAAVSCAN